MFGLSHQKKMERLEIKAKRAEIARKQFEEEGAIKEKIRIEREPIELARRQQQERRKQKLEGLKKSLKGFGGAPDGTATSKTKQQHRADKGSWNLPKQESMSLNGFNQDRQFKNFSLKEPKKTSWGKKKYSKKSWSW